MTDEVLEAANEAIDELRGDVREALAEGLGGSSLDDGGIQQLVADGGEGGVHKLRFYVDCPNCRR